MATEGKSVVQEIPPADPAQDTCYEELKRLFALYRLCNLNVRYYGRRAARYESYQSSALILAAVLSALALALILAVDPSSSGTPIIRWVAVGASSLGTILLAVLPTLGLSERIRELRALHFAYGQLFVQVEAVIVEIRRADDLTQELLGMSRVAHETYLRLHALDELDPNAKLIDEETAKVDKAFPANYIWERF